MTAVKDAAAGFEISYNGVTFGPLMRYQIYSTPQYDAAHRVVTHIRYTLQVTSWEYAADEDTLSADLLDKREKLQEAGGTLVLEDIGLGNTDTSSSHQVVTWGPHPIRCNFTPLGGGVCWQLDWAVQFDVSECRGSYGTTRRPLLAYNYEANYANDAQGFTTRAVSGYIQIPQRQAGQLVTDSPINYRDRVAIAVPYGYERVSRQWREDVSKTRLNFSIVDQQLKREPFPVGISNAQLTFSFGNRSMGFQYWTYNVSGSMETIPGIPKAHAAVKFFQIVFHRIQLLRRTLGPTQAVIPEQIRVSTQPFDRVSTFSMSYRVTGSLRDMMRHAVLYDPLPDSDYNRWRTGKVGGVSVEDLWRNGGQTDLKNLALSDKLVDVCPPATFNVGVQSSSGRYDLSSRSYLSPAEAFNCKGISEANSWLFYEPIFDVVRDDNVTITKGDTQVTRNLGPAGNRVIPSYSKSDHFMGAPFTHGPKDDIVRLGTPEQLVIYRARALRLKYPPSIGTIPSAFGVELDYIGGREQVLDGPNFFGCGSYFARWIQVYRPRGYIPKASLTSTPFTAKDLRGPIPATIR